MPDKLYAYRFELFFFSQVILLFGSLLPIPNEVIESILFPFSAIVNSLTGIVLLRFKNKSKWFLVVLFFIIITLYIAQSTNALNSGVIGVLLMITNFIFYGIITIEIIEQVWNAILINQKIILGLISGYLSLGLMGFFICMCIESAHPGSFNGVTIDAAHPNLLTEDLMYYSYITLLTIGYGDMLPITALAKKAAVLIGIMGQFYLVIITAIVVGKLLNQKTKQ